MKRILSYIAALLLAAAALAGCAPNPKVSVTTLPAAALNEPPEDCISGYAPSSGSDLFEDEDYIIFRNRNGILVFDKSANETLAVLPHCSAFTYYDKKVYYTGYDADTGKSNITEYSVPSGNEKIVMQLDNMDVSMLAYGGRLYYTWRTDPEDASSAELRSVDLGGGDMQIIGAKHIKRFVIKDGSVYYNEVYRSEGYVPCLYKLSLNGGDKVKMTKELFYPSRFEIIGDKLLYPEDHYTIGFYDLKTGETSSVTPDIEDWSIWDSDFALLGRYIVFTDPGDFLYGETSYVRAYDLDSGSLYDMADSDCEWYDIHTAKDGVYISPDKTNGTSLLFKAAVSDGKASLTEIIDYAPPDKRPSPDTVIISSYGDIRGGYSDGRWLTHSEAAAYCKGEMTFSRYNLAGLIETVESSGVTCHEEADPCIASHTYLMPTETSDQNACFCLDIPKGDHAEYDYSKDPLCFSYLYYGGKLPDIETVSDTSDAKRAVQNLLDKKLGEGKAEANIRAAVSADIDGDGEKETVVNSDNCVGKNYATGDDLDEGDSWYCLSCIIEGDGAVKVIDDYYFVPTPEEPCPYNEEFMFVQNIIDIDGDGISELVVDWTGGEQSETDIYKYDGNNVKAIMYFWVNYDNT